MSTLEKRPLMISRGWIQAAGIVLIIGFSIMGVLTYYTYNDEPPIPGIVKNTHGAAPFTRGDIMSGQQVFLGGGLMEYGSIFRHGAYLGPGQATTVVLKYRSIPSSHTGYEDIAVLLTSIVPCASRPMSEWRSSTETSMWETISAP
jgi:nitric oxide reductase subunit B